MKRGRRFLKAYDSCPALVYIFAFGHLCHFLRKPRQDASPIDAAHFQSDHLPFAVTGFLKEPVGVFLTLHAPNNAPCSVAMGQCQCYCLGAIFCDPVVVMLIDSAQVGAGPRKRTTTQNSRQIQRKRHSRFVSVPF